MGEVILCACGKEATNLVNDTEWVCDKHFIDALLATSDTYSDLKRVVKAYAEMQLAAALSIHKLETEVKRLSDKVECEAMGAETDRFLRSFD